MLRKAHEYELNRPVQVCSIHSVYAYVYIYIIVYQNVSGLWMVSFWMLLAFDPHGHLTLMQDLHLKLRLADEVDQSLGNCGLSR